MSVAPDTNMTDYSMFPFTEILECYLAGIQGVHFIHHTVKPERVFPCVEPEETSTIIGITRNTSPPTYSVACHH